MKGGGTDVGRRSTAEPNPAVHLKEDQPYGPSVRLLERDGRLIVEKTYRGKPRLIRLLGWIHMVWERSIYSKLDGVEGIPKTFPPPDRLTLLTEFMGGTNLRESSRLPNERYFQSLTALLERMHARGVVHLDLRNLRNYGMDPDGNPYLLDFVTSLYIPWDGRFRRLLERVDWMGVAKAKAAYQPQLLDARERKLFNLGERLSSIWFPTIILRSLQRRALLRKPSPSPPIDAPEPSSNAVAETAAPPDPESDSGSSRV